MTATETRAATAELVGGALCLDFTNTVGAHRSAEPRDYLNSYADLVAWGEHAGILAGQEARALLDEAARRPADAAVALERAIGIREALYRVFTAISDGREPGAADLATVNAALAAILAQSRLVPAEGGFAWEWSGSGDALDRPLWPVLRSAADLLTAPDLRRVRECAGDTCGWLFVDTSKNHSRRWCSMEDCGNRAKARRHYQRRRVAGQPDA